MMPHSRARQPWDLSIPPRPCLPGPLQPPVCGAGQGCPQQTSGGGPTWTAIRDPDAGWQRRRPQATSPQSQTRRPHSAGYSSAGGSVLPEFPAGTPLLTPSSSSMISVPMEARVVHLQLLVALTAQRLCALNLQTARWRGSG